MGVGLNTSSSQQFSLTLATPLLLTEQPKLLSFFLQRLSHTRCMPCLCFQALDAQDLKSAEMSFAGGSSDEESETALELREKLRVVRTVLEQGGHFSGVNRKVQLKPVRWTTFPQVGHAQ